MSDTFESISWNKDSFKKNWDYYNGRKDSGPKKGYVLSNDKTGKDFCYILLSGKTPDQVKDPHLGWSGWTAREVRYEDV